VNQPLLHLDVGEGYSKHVSWWACFICYHRFSHLSFDRTITV